MSTENRAQWYTAVIGASRPPHAISRARRVWVGSILALVTACGPIRGEVIEGRGGDARPAANLRVDVYSSPRRHFARCDVIDSARTAGLAVRSRLADSVYRATGTTPDGPSERDRRITENIERLAYGDPARAIIAQRDSQLRTMGMSTLLWSGQTDGQGKFRTRLLGRASYVVEVAGTPRVVSTGFFGARFQGTYYGFDLPRGCNAQTGRL